MAARVASERNPTTAERRSDRELVVTRTFDHPARVVFEAWTRPELFQRWWVPRSLGLTLLSCELDVRVGGRYRLVFRTGAPEPMAFFGRYLEVTPHTRLAWTNEEGGEAAAVVTTVTFEERDGRTLLAMSDRYPSKEVLDAAIASGSAAFLPGPEGTVAVAETFRQLDEVLAERAS